MWDEKAGESKMTSSPAEATVSIAVAIPSIAPDVMYISLSGLTSIPWIL